MLFRVSSQVKSSSNDGVYASGRRFDGSVLSRDIYHASYYISYHNQHPFLLYAFLYVRAACKGE